MKVTMMLLLAGVLHVSANSYSQAKVTLQMKNSSLEKVLDELERLTEYTFFYKKRFLEQSERVNVQVNEQELTDVLNEILIPGGLNYKISGNVIVIVPAGARQQEQEVVRVSGRVVDERGDPLPGATVLVAGTTRGVISDDQGRFSIYINPGGKLTVSFVGYKSFTQEITEATEKLLVKLFPDELEIEGVVVTGLLTRRKSGFSGASTVITKEELKRVSTGNIFTTLSILDAGFKINENNLDGSNPNVLPDFTIRGKGSFQNGSTSPIFILDGFEVSAQKIFDMDINRIESITLLKDASATILYGSRASNGVIVIETIAPQTGQLRLNYDFKPTVAFADLTVYDLMNAKEKLEYERLADVYVGYDAHDQQSLDDLYYSRLSNVLRGVDTYWLSQPVQDAFSHAHSLFVEGGVDQVRYGIDLGYNQNKGVMKKSGRDRLNFGFTLIYRIRDKVTIKNYASYSHVKAYDSPYGSYSVYGKLNPYEMPRNEQGELVPILSDGEVNPLYDSELPNRSSVKTQEFREQLSVDWFIKERFRARGQFAITKSTDKMDRYRSPFASEFVLTSTYNPETQQRDYIPLEKRGSLTKGDGESLSFSGNLTLSYDLLMEKHILSLGLGAKTDMNESNNYSFTVTGFPDDRYSDPAFAIQYQENGKANSNESKSRAIGFFGNANYIYDNRYFADFSFTYEGSSKFGKDKRFAPFFALGAGWNIHNEPLLKPHKEIVDILKIKYSYGLTGNQEFSSYQAKTSYRFVTDRLYDNSVSIELMGYGNPNLKWQSQHEHNIGLDLGFLQSRYRLAFNYYYRTTEGMLTDITVAPSLGLVSNSYKANLGKIRNTGIELNVNAVLIRNQARELEWSINLQGAHNKNTLLEISKELKKINDTNNEDKFTPQFVYEEGQSMSVLKAVRSLGIDPNTGKEIFLTKEGEVTYQWDVKDKVICGDTEPKLFGTIGSNLYWKGWNLNISAQYRTGAEYYNQTLASRVEGADPKFNADRRVLNDRWTTVGQHALYKNIKEYTTTYISTRFVQKEHLFQVSSLSLSYEFGKELLNKLSLSSLRLSFYANDLFRFSTIKQERGLDYPFQRSFVFGLNVSL